MKLIDILKEALSGDVKVMIQSDIDLLRDKGFEIIKTRYGAVVIEKNFRAKFVDWSFVQRLLNSKNIPFKVSLEREEPQIGSGRNKQIEIDVKYFDKYIKYPPKPHHDLVQWSRIKTPRKK
jgi:hypothetical protein